MSVSSFQCTSCGSGDIQRLAMIYEAGTSVIDTTTRGTVAGAGIGGSGSLGLGGGVTSHRTTGTQMTALASRAAPPEKAKVFLWVFLGWLVGVLLAAAFKSITAFLLPIAGACYLAWRGSRYNSKVWPDLKAKWDRSWLCHRCGSTFVA